MSQAINQKTTTGSLKHLAIRGSIWTLGGYGTAQFLRLISNIILARLLFPEAFGLMALVSVFMQGLAMFSEIGTKASIIQNPRGDEPAFLNTAWTIQAVRGLTLWIIACIGAYPFSLLYNEPLLAWMIPIAGLTALIAGFESTGLATASRQIKLKKLTLLEIYGQIASIAVMITIAALFETVWALVAGGLTSAIVKLILSHLWIAKMRNRFGWDSSAARALINFGKWIVVSTILTFFISNADRLIFGQLVSTGMLGVYSIALAFASIPHAVVSRLGGAIIFPVYSRKYLEKGSLNSVFYRVRAPLVTFGGASTAILFLSGPFIINVLYDERYVEAGWILQTLVIGVWFIILETACSGALLSMGKPKYSAYGNGSKLIGMLILIPIGHLYWGFQGAVTGFALSNLVHYLFSATIIARHGLSVFSRDLAIIALWCATIGLGFLTLRWDYLSSLGELPKLAVVIALVLILWLPLLIPSMLALRGKAATS